MRAGAVFGGILALFACAAFPPLLIPLGIVIGFLIHDHRKTKQRNARPPGRYDEWRL